MIRLAPAVALPLPTTLATAWLQKRAVLEMLQVPAQRAVNLYEHHAWTHLRMQQVAACTGLCPPYRTAFCSVSRWASVACQMCILQLRWAEA